MKSNQPIFRTIVNCERCGKDGIVDVPSDQSVKDILRNNIFEGEGEYGFTYDPLVKDNSRWFIVCSACKQESDDLIQRIKDIKKKFFEFDEN